MIRGAVKAPAKASPPTPAAESAFAVVSCRNADVVLSLGQTATIVGEAVLEKTMISIIRVAKCALTLSLLGVPANAQTPERYKNFQASVYTREQEVAQMGDDNWLRPRWEIIRSQAKVSKIYLETHRDHMLVDEATLNHAIAFFRQQGLQVAGGITFTISEPNRFETFCYSNPEHRAWVKKVVEFTAKHFDELMLDDFFFTSCKPEGDITAKGTQSWRRYRLKLMTDPAQSRHRPGERHQSARQSRHQVPQLVRALPGPRL